MSETSIIHQIGIHMTGETAVPTLPAKGSHMTMTGFVTVGDKDGAGHDANLDEESVTLPFKRERIKLQGPRAQAVEEIIPKNNGADEFEFTCYDGSEALFALDSSITITSHVGEMVMTLTNRTVLIEVNGLWVDYFPKCEVQISQSEQGYGDDGAARTKVKVTPQGTEDVPGGWQRHWFQAA